MGGPEIRRSSRQLQVILEELRKVDTHPTADELYQSVRKRLPRISLGTVYRNLERLARSETIGTLEFAGSRTRFDGNMAPHYHVRCDLCDRVEDVYDIPVGPAVAEMEDLNGYKVLGHRMEFVGICPGCRSGTDDPIR